jgi:hypothetical protein
MCHFFPARVDKNIFIWMIYYLEKLNFCAHKWYMKCFAFFDKISIKSNFLASGKFGLYVNFVNGFLTKELQFDF